MNRATQQAIFRGNSLFAFGSLFPKGGNKSTGSLFAHIHRKADTKKHRSERPVPLIACAPFGACNKRAPKHAIGILYVMAQNGAAHKALLR